jgi:hypothetical protein
MARSESEREDLLREATALVERAELRIPSESEPIVVGFRRDGSASFFFGADPVYQFNSAGELRRAFISGLLYKAERGQLVSLRRERSATEVALIRTELKTAETQAILADAHHRLRNLQQALLSGNWTIIGEVPPNADLISRIKNWLAQFPSPIRVAQGPRAC